MPATPNHEEISDEQPVAVKRYAFDADEVDGELQAPGFIFVTGDAAQARLGSLIEIPSSLEPSMTKMEDDRGPVMPLTPSHLGGTSVLNPS